MTDDAPDILEERLTKLEADLGLANVRLREFEAWRRRSVRGFLFGVATIVGLATIVSRPIAANGNLPIFKGQAPLTVEAPFMVVDSSGHPIARIKDNGNGGMLTFYSTSGQDMVEIGTTKAGDTGVVDVAAPDEKHNAVMEANNALGAWVGVTNEALTPVGALGVGAINGTTTEPAIFLQNQKGPAVALRVVNDTGELQLNNAAGDIRVEAGTEKNDDGAVKVTGPRGQCLPQIAGIACMITAR
jgi:hypothetical protein